MTTRKHRDDIMIGEDEWIEFIDLEGRYDQAVEIDQYLNDLWPLIDKLETFCVAECCGFDAYDFTREGIANALADLNRAQLHQACATAMSNIEQIESSVIMSSKMNNLVDKHTFMQLLGHIKRNLCGGAAQQGGAPDALAGASDL